MLRLSIMLMLALVVLSTATLQRRPIEQVPVPVQSAALPSVSNLDHQTASIKSNRHRPVHIPNYSKPEVPVPPVHYPLPIPTPSYPNYPQPIPIDIVTINPPSVPGGHGGYEIPPEIPEATFRPSPPWSHPEEEISHPEPIPEPIISSFSCIGRYYGYYADVENDCTVFHVCNPTYTATGYPEVQQASFRCGPGSVFSQQKLTCVHPHQTEPCHTSPDFYSVNEEFGKIQPKPQSKTFPIFANFQDKIVKPTINRFTQPIRDIVHSFPNLNQVGRETPVVNTHLGAIQQQTDAREHFTEEVQQSPHHQQVEEQHISQ